MDCDYVAGLSGIKPKTRQQNLNKRFVISIPEMGCDFALVELCPKCVSTMAIK